jgi:carboxylesterase type B
MCEHCRSARIILRMWNQACASDRSSQPAYCLQSSSTTPDQSEDCLYLNVYAPAVALDTLSEPVPVMLWLYGGSWTSGGVA